MDFVSSQTLILDDFAYRIAVCRDGNERYYGYWECDFCEDQSSTPRPVANEQSAIDFCKRQITKHHTEMHSDSIK